MERIFKVSNVLHIINYVYPAISGIGVTAMDIANSLKNNAEISQKIICINYNIVKDGEKLDSKKDVTQIINGIEIIRCKMDFLIASQAISISYIKALKNVFDNFEPDIVIFHYPNPFLAKLLLRYKKRPFKLIIWWHSDIIRQKILRLLFIKQNYDLLDRADRIIATSENYVTGSRYLSKYSSKCTVIPSCIHEDELIVNAQIEKRASEIKSCGKIMCFSMGRHVKYKGFKYLIEASKYLNDNYEFYIGSSGPLTEQLREKVRDDPRFHFTGYLSKDDLCAYYLACDIFCFPSITRNEAFGLALAEAMYYGKPAVTFAIQGSGVNYVSLSNVTGIECRNRDARQFAKAIEAIASNETMRRKMGENAHKRVAENFTFEIFRKRVIGLFNSL